MVVIVELSQKGMTVGDDVFRPNRAAAVSAQEHMLVCSRVAGGLGAA